MDWDRFGGGIPIGNTASLIARHGVGNIDQQRYTNYNKSVLNIQSRRSQRDDTEFFYHDLSPIPICPPRASTAIARVSSK